MNLQSKNNTGKNALGDTHRWHYVLKGGGIHMEELSLDNLSPEDMRAIRKYFENMRTASALPDSISKW
jgi:hypothetical protein